MNLIQKAPETMTSRERVKKTFNLERTDRVTIGYETNEGIHGRLSRVLGIPAGDMEAIYQVLGVDYRGIGAPYTGPQLFHVPPDRRVNELEGCVMRYVPHEGGGYWDFCDFPLADADDEAFLRFPVPDPDCFDYDQARRRAAAYDGQVALFAGGAGTPDLINANGRIMGMEDVLCHIATDYEPAIRFMRRRIDFQLRHLERLLEACRGLIDFVWLGEDLGTQIAPMISLELYRRFFKPIHKQFCDLAAHYRLPVIVHTCGSSSWAYEDFIEIGVRAVDTLQPEAANMSPRYLAERFGGRLGFRGCISTAGPLAYGTPEDVVRDCREVLSVMMPVRGYHFAPTHAIQDNTPVENILAMYNTAHRYGRTT
ncbi:MAG: uroporphyrinogen decarboxylase family protein [Eubacteriales bacterium]|nr:uroporphyrinogen decarboxylase family protein [Eubacteriales bacterium]